MIEGVSNNSAASVAKGASNDETSLSFQNTNRGKRSITLDLRPEPGSD